MAASGGVAVWVVGSAGNRLQFEGHSFVAGWVGQVG